MREVGELFGTGEMPLPFVLESAEVMKLSVKVLEPLLKKAETKSKGTLLLATVRGDVHDIGKNLVKIIIENNGFDVIDLGIRQPINNILSAINEYKPDVIGMSGLLVKSSWVMKENLEILSEKGIKLPVIVGGAALTRKFVKDTLQKSYLGKVFYANDAFEGLRIMRQLYE